MPNRLRELPVKARLTRFNKIMATEQIIFGASIIVAFLSGIVALFAPCCITFLLPAYVGQILRIRTKILFGTIFFSLGIAVVMIPIALGFREIVMFFSRFHTATYVVGGLLMVFFGVWTLLGKKMHLPFSLSGKSGDKVDLSSLFGLGVVSGITSACCAPVLAGALMLAGFSATLLKTIAVGFAYVAGMVFPLFIGALFWESNPLRPLRSFLAKPIFQVSRGNFISGILFMLVGVSLSVLALLGKIAMPSGQGAFGALMNRLVFSVGSFLKNYTFLEYIFLGVLVVFIVLLAKKVGRS